MKMTWRLLMCSNNSEMIKVSVGDKDKNNANQWATVMNIKPFV